MAKHLVLVGGGHAHMMTLANINAFVGKGHRVTVIGPSEHHYYSGMGPGMPGGAYSPSDIRFATKHVVEKQGGDYLLVFNMGGGKWVLRKKWLTFGGRLAFIIKDYIDRKFMKKFQAIE